MLPVPGLYQNYYFKISIYELVYYLYAKMASNQCVGFVNFVVFATTYKHRHPFGICGFIEDRKSVV